MPRYSAEVRAAVIAQVLKGVSLREAARQHGVSHTQVQRWCDKENVPARAAEKDIGELVEEHLRLEIQTLGAIAEHAQDKEWLSQQPAGELGTFFGIMSDKAHLKLAALERAQRAHEAQQDTLPDRTDRDDPPPGS